MADRRRRLREWVLTLATLAASGLLAACTTQTKPTFDVDRPEALLDQPIHIRLTGVTANQPVTVTARGTDTASRVWLAEASYVADTAGVVDLTTAVAESGSYHGAADGMGLFWSMNPDGADGDMEIFRPATVDGGGSYELELSAAVDGKAVASTTVRRVFQASGVNKRALVLNVDGVLGTLFTPPDGSPKRPGVLLLGGSEGGAGPVVDAALLASHGYPALALSYFGQPGLPQTLRDIPMEYFATAAGLLAKEPSLDSRQVVTWGYSRGTEPAVLLAEFYPELVRGVILYAPTQRVNVGFPDLGTAWTRGNQPVPGGPLPVAHVAGPVLAIAGGADKVWLSGPAATDLKVALDAAHTNVRHEVLLYAAAGHGVGSFPYYPGPTRPVHPVLRRPILLGGSREANESARADGYPKMLTFLTALAGKP